MTVLFVCEGNVARSQMAAAFLASARLDLTVISAGTAAHLGKPIDPHVLQVMAEINLPLINAYRKPVTPQLLAVADRIISFVPPARLNSAGNNIEVWTVADPRGQDVPFFRLTRDDIRRRVTQLITELPE